MKKFWKLILAVTCALALLCETAAFADSSNSASGGHEPLTICTPNRDIARFIEYVQSIYPEIEFDVIAYTGANASSYLNAQLVSDNIPDIFMINAYVPGMQDLSDKLIDLSGYSFTGNYIAARLHDVMDNGAIYLLPSYYTCFGITYNKTILEENGWELPQSFEELEELKPKVEAAGYTFCLDQLGLPGYGFQYMCNIADTGYFSTLGGRKWQRDFLNGETTLADSPEMLECFDVIKRWRDLGMLNGKSEENTIDVVRKKMSAGDVLFMLGSSNDLSAITEEGGPEFGLMPYLSENGDQNIYVLNVTSYMGLSKCLEQSGNEQKLEDAIKVMELLSTPEGMSMLNNETIKIAMLPLNDAPLSENVYYSSPEVLNAINSGYTAPFIYNGWENVVVDMGNKMLDFISGDCEIEDVIARFDEDQKLITDNVEDIITTATETISNEDCARLVGIALAEGANADAALISLNKYNGIVGDVQMNKEGVSGNLYAMPISEMEITTILPTNWGGTIKTITLTGARINEVAQEGYLIERYGAPAYPYLLTTKDDKPLEDDKTYTVVICGATEALLEEGQVQDSGVVGLDAMKDYLGRFETLTASDIKW